jgi:hypothetical protein
MVRKAVALKLHESCQKVFASASHERLSSGVSFLSPGRPSALLAWVLKVGTRIRGVDVTGG